MLRFLDRMGSALSEAAPAQPIEPLLIKSGRKPRALDLFAVPAA